MLGNSLDHNAGDPYQDGPDTTGLLQHFFNADTVTSLDGYSVEQGVPLFSLTNDFTTGAYFWQ